MRPLQIPPRPHAQTVREENKDGRGRAMAQGHTSEDEPDRGDIWRQERRPFHQRLQKGSRHDSDRVPEVSPPAARKGKRSGKHRANTARNHFEQRIVVLSNE